METRLQDGEMDVDEESGKVDAAWLVEGKSDIIQVEAFEAADTVGKAEITLESSAHISACPSVISQSLISLASSPGPSPPPPPGRHHRHGRRPPPATRVLV